MLLSRKVHESRAWVVSSLLVAACGGLISGCASAERQAEGQAERLAEKSDSKESKPEAEANAQAQLAEIRTMMTQLGNRLDSIETRMGSLSDKVASAQSSVETLMANRKALSAPVASHPSNGAGTEPESSTADNDPEAGFLSDAAIQEYRKGSILLDAHKYPEAVLAFSTFVDRYPDHPLAGSAQYGIGAAYLRQKEYKLAQRELERVLTSYDRSPHVSDTLRDLADAEDALKLPEQAARHRQLLRSLFPHSPAAALNAGNAGDSGNPDSAAKAKETGAVEGAPQSPAPVAAPQAGAALDAHAAPEIAAKGAVPTAPITANAHEGQ